MEAVPQETVEKLMGNVPAQKELEGIRILASSPGSVRYEIDVPDNVLNYHGCIHGGFVSTMLEIAAGMATWPSPARRTSSAPYARSASP